jgi:hypothetical protein
MAAGCSAEAGRDQGAVEGVERHGKIELFLEGEVGGAGYFKREIRLHGASLREGDHVVGGVDAYVAFWDRVARPGEGAGRMRAAMNHPIGVFVATLVVLWIAALVGVAVRKRLAEMLAEGREDFGVILTATVTLLGLIIGISFSMAVSRYDQRKNYEEQEANAIGTEYLRVGVVAGSGRGQGAGALEELFGAAREILSNPRQKGIAGNQYAHGPVASATLGRGAGAGKGFADVRGGFGGSGHESCVEFAGVHAGGLVEPDTDCRLGADVDDRRVLQLYDWVLFATGGAALGSVAGDALGGVHFVFS